MSEPFPKDLRCVSEPRLKILDSRSGQNSHRLLLHVQFFDVLKLESRDQHDGCQRDSRIDHVDLIQTESPISLRSRFNVSDVKGNHPYSRVRLLVAETLRETSNTVFGGTYEGTRIVSILETTIPVPSTLTLTIAHHSLGCNERIHGTNVQ
jgi:hypothetical protein